jgi:hypothetical protein
VYIVNLLWGAKRQILAAKAKPVTDGKPKNKTQNTCLAALLLHLLVQSLSIAAP